MKKKQAKKVPSAKRTPTRKGSKLVKVCIDRQTWCRGDKNLASDEGSYLLTDKNTRCCLGFDLKCRGYTDKKLKYKPSPWEVGVIKGLSSVDDNTHICQKMMEINDDDSISDKMREYRLKQLARKIGRDYVFIN